MTDAPRLLTPEEVEAWIFNIEVHGGRMLNYESRRALHTLRAAWAERDAARAALQDAIMAVDHIQAAYGDRGQPLVKALCLAIERWHAALVQMQACDLDAREGERDAARAALAEYGQHKSGCPQAPEGTYVIGSEYRRRPCDCGLDAALGESAGQDGGGLTR